MTTMERPTIRLQRRALLALALSAGLVAATGAEASIDLVDLTVVDRETGETLAVWRSQGRMFVAGQPGSRYSLRVTNRSGARVLAVMSVDGVNILTGETAGYNQRGYVLGPYQTQDINGWRKSTTEVAAFSFAAHSSSYAARTGRPLDVGVIGVAAFRERMAAPPPRLAPMPVSPPVESRYRSERRSTAPAAAADEVVVTGSRVAPPTQQSASRAAEERLGTAHGARERSFSTRVNFERASSRPDMIRRIEYDTHHNLVVAGVIPREPPSGRRPRAFPDSVGYVPDPPERF